MADEHRPRSGLDIVHATMIEACYAKAISSSTPITHRNYHAAHILNVYSLLSADMRNHYAHMVEPMNAVLSQHRAPYIEHREGHPEQSTEISNQQSQPDTSQPHTAGPLSSATKSADGTQNTNDSTVTAPVKRKPRRPFTEEEDARLAEEVERRSDEKTIQEAFPDRARATLTSRRHNSLFLSRLGEMRLRKQLGEERRVSQVLEVDEGGDRGPILEEQIPSPVQPPE
ncbi:hypothetical protein LTS10_009139 [Elasticomyces elasticus]|nr:hypothetical protein LTS10_009139 [Elasticomyces elasticus]